MPFDWRRLVIFTHRWLGICGGLFIAAWFASGIVMMYARMPRLSPADRVAHLEPLDLSSARLSPHDVAERQHLGVVREVRVAMVLGRPVYQLLTRDAGWTMASAQTGDPMGPVGRDEALEVARRFASPHGTTARYDARIEEPDHWTLEIRSSLPLHRIAIGDDDGTYLYVSERFGEVLLRTTARERRIAYTGAVLHWLFFTPFRRHTTAWTQAIIWMSIAGCILCALGLVWGLYVGIPSTYRGWMRWHHYSGLLFGLVTFTWIFSGLLSMDPWDWHPSTSPTRAQREAFSGGTMDLDSVSVDELRRVTARPKSTPGRQIEIVPFQGHARVIVDGQPEDRIDSRALLDAARRAMPDAVLADATWLDDYDAYYYDRSRELPLPVLRVRYDDRRRTWLYIDVLRGTAVRKEESLTRVNRWLYHGLHSLDFPPLYRRRPLWDIVVIVLSLGGLASVVTAATPAWRRVRRHVTLG